MRCRGCVEVGLALKSPILDKVEAIALSQGGEPVRDHNQRELRHEQFDAHRLRLGRTGGSIV